MSTGRVVIGQYQAARLQTQTAPTISEGWGSVTKSQICRRISAGTNPKVPSRVLRLSSVSLALVNHSHLASAWDRFDEKVLKA